MSYNCSDEWGFSRNNVVNKLCHCFDLIKHYSIYIYIYTTHVFFMWSFYHYKWWCISSSVVWAACYKPSCRKLCWHIWMCIEDYLMWNTMLACHLYILENDYYIVITKSSIVYYQYILYSTSIYCIVPVYIV